MWHPSLRLKIALLAVVSCAAALAAGAVSMWFALHRTELRQLDESLTTGAQEFFRDLENFDGLRREQRTEITDRFVPPSLRGRLVELTGRHGELLFRSANLGDTSLAETPGKFSTRVVNGTTVRLGVFPHEDVRLVVGTDLGEVQRAERNLGLALLTALPVVVVIIAAAGSFLARRALRPVDEVTRAAGQITAARLAHRLPEPRTHDEIHRLVAVLNAMFERLQRSFEQAVRFSADASHQLKTPLSVLRAGLDELLLSPRLDAEDKAALDILLDQVRRLTSLTQDLLLLARADAGRLEVRKAPCDLRTILDDCLDDARALAEEKHLVVETDLPPRLELEADLRWVALIVQNLLENAVKYNRTGGRIEVRASVAEPWLELCIANTGTPIPPERQAHVFDRFSRGFSDERIAGTGLGLSLARELARAQGGEIALAESTADRTEFRLRLPLSAAGSAAGGR